MAQSWVVFSHGQESGPWGTKIRRLADVATARGYQILSVDYTDLENPEDRVARLCQQAPPADPLVLVGSSMGGYVAARASRSLDPDGLFLMAPALGMAPSLDPDPPLRSRYCTIVHGWDDEVVPLDPVLAQARRARAETHLVPDGHRLQAGLDAIAGWFDEFLQRCRQR